VTGERFDPADVQATIPVVDVVPVVAVPGFSGLWIVAALAGPESRVLAVVEIVNMLNGFSDVAGREVVVKIMYFGPVRTVGAGEFQVCG